jgi:two-component system sensor histidine kinase BaeS
MRQHPEKWEQYLDTLAHEADHQAGLVEGILEISRIDAGRMEMKPRPTSLNELTEAVVASHHVLAEERGLTLEHRPETRLRPEAQIEGFFGKDPVSLVDPERMMQVLNNLVGNGIRYTPEGGTVVVSTGTKEAEGRTWATVTVADTGMGIPEDELPHVFDRFFRGAEPRAMQLTGTGLGLAIAKEIVELHGGYVTVESPSTGSGQAPSTALRAGEEGVGSTFTVWLPLSDQSRSDRFLSEPCQVWPDH